MKMTVWVKIVTYVAEIKANPVRKVKGGPEEINCSKYQHLCGPVGHIHRTQKGRRSGAPSNVLSIFRVSEFLAVQ